MFPIEKHIPIPRERKRPPNSKYPHRHMEVGDSFLVPCEPCEARLIQQRLSVANSTAANKLPGKKFKTQREPAGIRVWRIK